MSYKINVLYNIVLFSLYAWSVWERHRLKREILRLEWQLYYSRNETGPCSTTQTVRR